MYHTAEMLEVIARRHPPMLAWTTVCVLDDPGPDTTSAIAGWLTRFDGILVAARVDPREFGEDRARRVLALGPGQLAGLSDFAKVLASLVAPGGVLVQDIHLSTLHFIPPDRWWESIYVAATVRGLFAHQPPAIRFVSNKRGYAATFGRDLMEAGFDPREVMDKSELADVVVPAIARDVDGRFPFEMTASGRPAGALLAAGDYARRDVEATLDLVEWEVNGRVELGGRLLSAPVTFRAGSQEGLTWQQLIADRLAGGHGVPVGELGERLAEAGAERAEISNLAARHIHALRARLASAAAIVTANRAYRLDAAVTVGQVRRRPPLHLR